MGDGSHPALERLDRVVAFDLETTGLEPESHRIVEFAFVVLDAQLEVVDTWSELVDPGVPIPQAATEIHGITDEEVQGCPRFEQLAPVVQSMVDEAVLMAYNHGFDRSFLHAELVRAGGYGFRDGHPFIDPMEIFREHVPGTPNDLQAAVAHYLDRDLDGAHRALPDTQAMVEVFRAQWEAHPSIGSSLRDVLVEHREWLDGDRKLYADADGVVRFGFGKHAGEPVLEKRSYAEWMLGADFRKETKAVLGRVLGHTVDA